MFLLQLFYLFIWQYFGLLAASGGLCRFPGGNLNFELELELELYWPYADPVLTLC